MKQTVLHNKSQIDNITKSIKQFLLGGQSYWTRNCMLKYYNNNYLVA